MKKKSILDSAYTFLANFHILIISASSASFFYLSHSLSLSSLPSPFFPFLSFSLSWTEYHYIAQAILNSHFFLLDLPRTEIVSMYLMLCCLLYFLYNLIFLAFSFKIRININIYKDIKCFIVEKKKFHQVIYWSALQTGGCHTQ